MSDDPNPNPPGVKPESSARARSRAKRGSKTPRTASPTRAIEPGAIHFKIAEGVLTGLRDRAGQMGMDLDIGEFPSAGDIGVDTDDPQQLVKIVAHAVARVGDKFTFLRRVSRHMEGSEKRAGILSDVSAALYALAKRNPDATKQLVTTFATDLQARRTARQAAARASKNGSSGAEQTPQTGVPQ